jgi:hypothetical protein
MSRRTPALVAIAALAAASALVGSGAAAATQHQHPSRTTHSSPPSVHIEARAAKPSGSVGVFGAQSGSFQTVSGVNGAKAHKTAVVTVASNDAVASAINPVGGNDSLLCTEGQTIFQVQGLRTTPHLRGSGIDASAYTGEGGAGYDFFCYSVAVHHRFALATADSQGLLQLIRKNGTWKIDTRVQFPGLNDAGQPHLPGWIDIRDHRTPATLFDTVAIAPAPLPNGTFLAVTVDREDGDDTVAVVKGVGTAKPKVAGAVTDHVLASDVSRFGASDVAFLPGSPNKALIATKNGFAVLGLGDPTHPKIRHKRNIAAAHGPVDPSSITISSDGDHVAVAIGNRVYTYKNVLAAIKHGAPFKPQSSFRLGTGADETVADVKYTANDTLAVLHGPSSTPTGWALTLVKKVPQGHHVIKGSTATTAPEAAGSLSVWPPA